MNKLDEQRAVQALYRNQLADLILKDDKGEDLVFVSPIVHNKKDSSMSFVVGENSKKGARYQITVKIEEI